MLSAAAATTSAVVSLLSCVGPRGEGTGDEVSLAGRALTGAPPGSKSPGYLPWPSNPPCEAGKEQKYSPLSNQRRSSCLRRRMAAGAYEEEEGLNRCKREERDRCMQSYHNYWEGENCGRKAWPRRLHFCWLNNLVDHS